MNVLIPESIAPEGIELLKAEKSLNVTFDPNLSFENVLEIIHNFEIIITRSGTPINEELLAKAKKLKLVCRAGVGIDNIDMTAASKKGVLVVNVPAGNILAATEHTISLLLASTRMIPQADQSIREGKWDRKKFMGNELNNKTLGIIGFGKIGTRVAKRLRAFDMKILAYDPYIDQEIIKTQNVKAVSLEELLKQSDFITVHTPLTQETKGMIGDKEFNLMKDGVRVVNCARGGIYEEDSLYKALKSGKVKSAAVDVFENEPLIDHKFKEFKNIVLTPHLGANTEEAQVNVSKQVAENVLAFLKHGFLPSALNAPFSDLELAERLLPYLNLSSKMSKIIFEEMNGLITDLKIKVFGFENDAVKPIVVSTVKGLLENVVDVGINFVNALFEAEERGINVTWEFSKKSTVFKQKIEVVAKNNTMQHRLAGTCFSDHYPRIVKIDDYEIEVRPDSYLLLVRNNDVPGVIGEIGTLFGMHKINIAEYRLGRNAKDKKALAAIILDQNPSLEVLEKLNKIEAVIDTTLIDLNNKN